jgi:putative flippase GtrA
MMPGQRVKTRERKPRGERAAGTLDAVPASDAAPPSTQRAAGATPHGLRARLGALVREFGKFGTVGGVAFATDFAIYNALLSLGTETLTAKSIATLLAATIAFAGNRFWTWRHRERGSLAREYTTFFLLNAVGLGIGVACLAISHYGLGQIWPALQSQLADNVAGVLVGTALGTLFRFWSYRRYVFRDAAVADPISPVLPAPPATATGAEHAR